MTDQYQNTNINSPRAVSTVSGGGTFTVTADDCLIVISAGAPTLNLPDAGTVAGLELIIKSIPGAGTAVPVAGQLIDAFASFTFTTAQQALFIKSDGSDWKIVTDETTIALNAPFVTVGGGGTLPSEGFALATGTPIFIPLATAGFGPVTVKNISGADIALTRTGADTVDTLTSITLLDNDAVTLKNDGVSDWRSFLEQPTQDDVFNNGSLTTRWAGTFSRLTHSTSQTGAGTNTITYGANNVGIFSGSVYSVLGGTATLTMTNPASQGTSPSMIAGGARSEIAGGTANVVATGIGAKVLGFARAETAHTATMQATGAYSLAGGGARTSGYNSTIEATGESSFAFGYCRPYAGAGYGATQIRATNLGSHAMGASQFFATIEATGAGAFARGRAYGFSAREAIIRASGSGSSARGFSGGGTIQATSFGSEASGYARTNAPGNLGLISATDLGSRAQGVADNGTIQATADGSDASGYSHGASGYPGLIQATTLGALARGVVNGAAGYDCTIQATSIGSEAHGYAATILADTGPALIHAGGGSGPSFAFGAAFYGNSTIQAFGEGAFAIGIAAADGADPADLLATQPGSFAGGAALGTGGYGGTIQAIENGAIAFGKASGGTIEANSEGSTAHGVTTEDRSISALGEGARAHGAAQGGAYGDITASAEGAWAHGRAAGGDIVASAINAGQFGIGTNSLADSFRVGVGPHLVGTIGAPGALANGQIWIDGAGDVFIRTGGVSKNITVLT